MPRDTHITRFNRPVLPALVLLPLLGVGVISSCASTFSQPAKPDYQGSQSEAEGDRESNVNRSPDEPASRLQTQTTIDPTTPADSNPKTELKGELDAVRVEKRALLDELKALYRRLHIELDTAGRSSLIVELFKDPRAELKLLGFELADRDLSASKVLGDPVVQAVRGLLDDSNPQIRAKSARLITRLAPPDGMIILTEALAIEDSQLAVDPMLMAIARWPNADAIESVRTWVQHPDAPLTALFSAAWALERESLWDPDVDHPLILKRLRETQPEQLREDGMKLLAKLGSADDLRELIRLMLSDNQSVVRWAASALVETPRSVEVLAHSAAENEVLYQAAAQSLINHRATPEGLRRLAELPQSDPSVRRESLVRMGQAVDREQLGEAVRLSRLEPDIAIMILSRLLTTEQAQTQRSSKGVLLLGELQLDAGRPNRVIEAMIALEGVQLDPSDQLRMDSLRVQSLILLNRFDEASSISRDYNLWHKAIERSSDPSQQAKVANELLQRADEQLTPEQADSLRIWVENSGVSKKNDTVDG